MNFEASGDVVNGKIVTSPPSCGHISSPEIANPPHWTYMSHKMITPCDQAALGVHVLQGDNIRLHWAYTSYKMITPRDQVALGVHVLQDDNTRLHWASTSHKVITPRDQAALGVHVLQDDNTRLHWAYTSYKVITPGNQAALGVHVLQGVEITERKKRTSLNLQQGYFILCGTQQTSLDHQIARAIALRTERLYVTGSSPSGRVLLLLSRDQSRPPDR
ncbi:hypothetical protein RRG08_050551 [Elysia crispata]|uniref:Uncharacterized protein n=1 Tax=Elysia crispata TaxID=231223 RepID=A0AAE1DC10_9GAST|nr:hypothetical protein RRG08_050551 [Elysia crispata]